MYIRNNEVTLFKYQATLTSLSQPRFELRSCRGQNLWYTLDREQASIQHIHKSSSRPSTGEFVGLTKQCASPCWKFHAEDSWSVGYVTMG